MNTLFALFTLFATLSQAVPQEPHCFHLGSKLFGKNLEGVCVHHTDDFSVAFDVVDGAVEMIVGPNSNARLEVYTEARMLTPSDNCCPPTSFLTELDCPRIQETGSCCISNGTISVTGVPDQAGCVHSVEDYASYVTDHETNSVSWSTENPEANPEVEVYASLMPSGCCGCFMYSIPCSPCEAN